MYNFPLLTQLRQLCKRMAKICSVGQLPYVLPKTSEVKKEDLAEDEEGEEEEVAGRIAVTVVITEIVIEITTETETMAATTTIEIEIMETTTTTKARTLTNKTKVTINKAMVSSKAMANNKLTASNKITDSKQHTDNSKPTNNKDNNSNHNKQLTDSKQPLQLTGRINTILPRPATQLLAQVKAHHQLNLINNINKDNTRNNILKHLRSQLVSMDNNNLRQLDNTPPPLQIKQCHSNRTARANEKFI